MTTCLFPAIIINVARGNTPETKPYRTEYGGIAQLGERLNGIQEVSGSIPLISTKKTPASFEAGVFRVYLSFRRGILLPNETPAHKIVSDRGWFWQ